MLTYKTHILKNIIFPLISIILLTTFVVWIVQILRLTPLIEQGIRIKSFLKLIIFLLPSLLFMILPIVTVISVIYVYNRLQEERQLVILRSSGLSNYDLIKPALLIAIIVTIISYYISMYLMPLSYSNLKQGLNNFKENYLTSMIHPKTFNSISKDYTIYVDTKSSNGLMQGIVLFDNKTPSSKTILFAKSAIITSSTPYIVELELIGGARHSYDQLNHLNKLYFDRLNVVISNNEDNSAQRTKTSIELYIHEMIWPDENFSTDRQKRLIIDGHLRIIWPLFNFGFVFLGLSIFLTQPYYRQSYIKKFLFVFCPILLAAYFHFTLQKIAYKDTDYIFLGYANAIICIIFGAWQSNKNVI